MSNIVVATLSAGHGHGQVARVLADTLSQRAFKVEVVEGFTLSCERQNDTFQREHRWKRTYQTMIKRAPFFWGMVDKMAESTWVVSSLSRMIRGAFDPFIKAVKHQEPDVVLTTHPLLTSLLARERESGRLPSSIHIYAVITDFTFHPLAYHPSVSGYFLANERMVERCQVIWPEGNFFATGIPVRRMDLLEKSRSTRASLGLPVDGQTPVIAVAGGGWGCINFTSIYETLESIEQPLHLIFFSGHRKLDRNRIQQHVDEPRHSLEIVDYTEEFLTYLQACDGLITKPGGVTVSEALTYQIPTILTSPLPGQETRNAEVLQRDYQMAYAKNEFDDLPRYVLDILEKNNVMREDHRLAADRIATWLEEFKAYGYEYASENTKMRNFK
ncbi:MGDG synthase family glycosyltransferase [Texcoconibacillus texcoconensis]|uniref:Processive 1,2-diacylglycerol beta-glucosyltransferase n=1 Tax=Texcoconibacillus texcoconensis TaxID=1095777 RepID=A0A840QLN4_9BACI|nr:glycosyltransferase [Texcoconibacillus texcoconensis]MBB5172266.1 processive 1,2-diacylglycerol beta-glucosyltransferase [Texcoconibacillus texcoconensis]